MTPAPASQPNVLDATIASDGTIISRAGTATGGGTAIVALDGATGTIKWQLAPPVSGPTVWYVALTSEGGLVAEQADGTVFGASD
jgi:outer membrane protein assembly factor BamB